VAAAATSASGGCFCPVWKLINSRSLVVSFSLGLTEACVATAASCTAAMRAASFFGVSFILRRRNDSIFPSVSVSVSLFPLFLLSFDTAAAAVCAVASFFAELANVALAISWDTACETIGWRVARAFGRPLLLTSA